MLITTTPEELFAAVFKSADVANITEWLAYERDRYGY
jgi:hypothetical protein